jgi:hypothetical protein
MAVFNRVTGPRDACVFETGNAGDLQVPSVLGQVGDGLSQPEQA